MYKSHTSNRDFLQQPSVKPRWAMFGKGGPFLGRPATAPRNQACGSHLNSEIPHQSCERQQGETYNRQQPWFHRDINRPKPHKGCFFSESRFSYNHPKQTQYKQKLPQPNHQNKPNQWSNYWQKSFNSFQTYADAARHNLKPKPNNLFNELHPKRFQHKKPFTAKHEILPQSFWEFSLKTQRQWQFNKSHSSLVNWFLRTRASRWKNMASGATQRRLLESSEALTVPGVIYAIIFSKSKEFYIGQSVNSSWHRWRQHLNARNKDAKEFSLQSVLQNNEKAANACVIPLEVILMPGMQKEGHHSQDFITEFRRRALIREQEWIRLSKSSFARVLNVAQNAYPPDSRNRRTRRNKIREERRKDPELQTRRKPNNKNEGNERSRIRKFVTVTDDGIFLDHTTPGDHHKVRKLLADLLIAQENGSDAVQSLGHWSRDTTSKVVSFLVDQLDEIETTSNKSRILFQFLANASLKGGATDRASDVPHTPTSKADPLGKPLQRHRPKKDKTHSWWLRVPWSREEFTSCRLQQFILTKDMVKTHPIKAVAEETRISYSLNQPQGVIMCNFTKVCKEILPSEPLKDIKGCPCLAYQTKNSLLYQGHVITTDPEAFRDLSLRQLWQQGRKHRLPANPSIAMDDLRKGLDEYIEKVCVVNKIDISAFIPWRTKLIAHMETHITSIPDSNWITQGGLSRQGLKELRAAQACMVIGPTDKSSHDFMMVCKTAYLNGLKNELTSCTYAPSTMKDEDIFESHKVLTEQLGRIPVSAHSYLYGAGKLHKEIASMRWIAGCSRQLVHKNRFRQFHHAATSISAVSSALGAALRFCMYQLEQKDISEYRTKLIKRYWITTSVDNVAKHIKVNQKELANESVWTVDFTTMYTKLPLRRILDDVGKAVKEAFLYYAQHRTTKDKKADIEELQCEDVRFNFTWSNYGDATLCIDDTGPFDMNNILSWMEKVLFGTYVKQSKDSVTLQQVVGVPMGGKSSSELANLYCYSVECGLIDRLLANGAEDVARSMYHTFRYIDDILGFGACQLHLLDYQMDYKQTNESPHTAVFLGMRVSTKGDFVQLSLEPKGAGWRWKPQRYVDWSSTHTFDTKRMLIKGLLVRAGTITNSIQAFKQAVQYYAEGLYARGFTAKILMDGFESYLRDYWIPFPFAANDIRFFFRGLLNKMYYPPKSQPSHTMERSGKQQTAPSEKSTKGALLCGLKAINHVLASIDRMPVRRDLLDDLAGYVANEEAAIRNDNTALETAPHQEGNYHVFVMELALRHLADMEVKIWRPNDAKIADAYIVGDGSHWQAVVKICGKWQLLDQRTEYISDLTNLLRLRSRQGTVLACFLPIPADQMETDRISKKRIFDDTKEPSGELLMITNGPSQTQEQKDIHNHSPDIKKAKTIEETQSSSSILMHMNMPFIGLQDATQQSNLTLTPVVVPFIEESVNEWKNVTVGSTNMLFNAFLNKYRCASEGCFFESTKAAGVAVHFARYCKFGGSRERADADTISIDSGDIGDDTIDAVTEK